MLSVSDWMSFISCLTTMWPMPELSPEDQQKDLQQVLQSLKGLIKNLPSSLPCGVKEGLIAKYFFDKAEYDEDEGLYFTINKAYDRVFKGSQNLRWSCLSCQANMALNEYTPA